MMKKGTTLTQRGIIRELESIAQTENQARMHRAICERIREISPTLDGVEYIYNAASDFADELEADAQQAREILTNLARVSGLSNYLSEKIND